MRKIVFNTPEPPVDPSKQYGPKRSHVNPLDRLLGLTACGLFFWFVTYAYLYIYGFLTIKPLYGYILFAVTALAGFLLRTRDSFRLSAPYVSALRPFYAWFLIYLAWLAANYSYAPESESAAQAFITATEMAIIGLCALFLFSISRPAPYLLATCVLAALIGLILNYVDFVAPQFSLVPGRAAGWYENPNLAGRNLSMLMVLSTLAIPRRIRLLWVLFMGGAIFVTFSRGSWLMWATGFAALLYFRWIDMGRKRSTRMLIVTGLSLFALFALFSGALLELLATSRFSDLLTANTIARLSGEFTDFSADSRLYLVWLALEYWTESPFLGHGLGFTTSWSEYQRPHNMFLLFLVEGGLVGLLIYCALPAIMWANGSQLLRVICLQFVVSSMFTHNNLEQIATVLLLSLAAVLDIRLFHQPDTTPLTSVAFR